MNAALPGTRFGRVGILSDPVYRYIEYTRNHGATAGEEAVLATPWVRRLRSVRQLQNAYLVFPAAEASRFQHSLGVMHLSGEWAEHLYPSLQRQVKDTPSVGLVVETMRLAGLLHDVGHGPLSHLFDEVVLEPRGLNHELIGQRIIRERLGELIAGQRRSPRHDFKPKESIDPDWVAFLMCEDEPDSERMPRWVRVMKECLVGPISTDNMDYLCRDRQQLGLPQAGVDVQRVMRYSLIGPRGLCFHSNAAGAVAEFLGARLSFYQEVYFHPSVRAYDLSVAQILGATLEEWLQGHDVANLDRYLELTDFRLQAMVEEWRLRGCGRQMGLGALWEEVFSRSPFYHLACQVHAGDPLEVGELDPLQFAEVVRGLLPRKLRDIDFVIDVTSKQTRSMNPLGQRAAIRIYDAYTKTFSEEAVIDLFRRLPERISLLRAYTRLPGRESELARAVARGLERWRMGA